MDKKEIMRRLEKMLPDNTDFGLVDDIETTEDGIDRVYVFWDKK
jgi:hypothetical protein